MESKNTQNSYERTIHTTGRSHFTLFTISQHGYQLATIEWQGSVLGLDQD